MNSPVRAPASTEPHPQCEQPQHQQQHDFHDDESVVSMLSESICRQFPWFRASVSTARATNGANSSLSGSAANYSNSNSNKNKNSTTASRSGQDEQLLLTQMQEKHDQVLGCLQGMDEQVNLWMLRELALSRGGLVSSSLRKRAWPKLMRVHETMLQQAKESQSQSVSDNADGLSAIVDTSSATSCTRSGMPQVHVSKTSMTLLQEQVAKTVWNVQDHVHMARELEEWRLAKMHARTKSLLASSRNGNKVKQSVTFLLPDLEPANSDDQDELPFTSPVKNVFLTPNKTITGSGMMNIDEDTNEDISMDVTDDDGTFSPVTLPDDASTALASHLPRRRHASRSEQKVLFNIVVSVLRLQPNENPFFEDDRYKCFMGLTDLAALLLIQVESPSLTSLILGRLAECHLRDSFRSSNAILEAAVQIIVMPLLCLVDDPVHTHMRQAGMTMPSFCVPWIRSWFAQQVDNLQVASRLMDVFMASHPLMPSYFSVALITHFRDNILGAPTKLVDVVSICQKLPLLITQDELEDIIEVALVYTSRFPPSSWPSTSATTIAETKPTILHMIPSVEMISTQPLWPSSAPTDYGLLQQVKAIRTASSQVAKPSVITKIASLSLNAPHNCHTALFAKARAATGEPMPQITKVSTKYGVLVLLSIFVIGCIAMMANFVTDVARTIQIAPHPLVNPAVPEKLVKASVDIKSKEMLPASSEPRGLIPQSLKNPVPAPKALRASQKIPAAPSKKKKAPVVIPKTAPSQKKSTVAFPKSDQVQKKTAVSFPKANPTVKSIETKPTIVVSTSPSILDAPILTRAYDYANASTKQQEPMQEEREEVVVTKARHSLLRFFNIRKGFVKLFRFVQNILHKRTKGPTVLY